MMSATAPEKKSKVRKFRSPKLTRLEKLTKGLLKNQDEVKANFSIKEVKGKGRGVFLKASVLRKDSFVLEYEGDIISEEEAQSRERVYAHNNEGCFIMSFTFGGAKWAIDATRRFDSYTRLLNHSRKPNIRFHPPILTDLNGRGPPRIAAYALRDICKGEEIVFDYGVQDGAIKWLRNKDNGFIEDVDGDSSSDESGDANSQGECGMTFTISQSKKLSSASSSNSSGCRSEQIQDGRSPESDDGGIVNYKRYRAGSSSVTSRLESYPLNYDVANAEDSGSRSRGKRKFCAGEWGLYFTRVLPGSSQNRFLAGYVNLGTPQKIMRCVEECGRKKQRSDDESVICLSSSSESSIRGSASSTAQPQMMDYRGPCLANTSQVKLAAAQLPANVAPNYINKVLEWQIPSSEEDNTLSIKIAKVQSLSDHLHAENITSYAQTSPQENSSNYAPASRIPLSSQRQQSVNSIYGPGTSRTHFEDTLNQHTKIKPKQHSNQPLAEMTSTKSIPKLAAHEVVAIDSSESDNDDGIHSLVGLRSTSPHEAASVKSSPPVEERTIKFHQNSNADSNCQLLDVLIVSDNENELDSNKQSKSHGVEGDLGGTVGDEGSEAGSLSSECEIIQTEGPNSSNQHLPAPARRLAVFNPIVSQPPQVAVIKPYVSPAAASPQGNQPVPTTSSSAVELTTSSSSEEAVIAKTEYEQLKNIFGSYIISTTVSHEDIQDTIYKNWDFFKRLIDRGISIDKIRRTVRNFFSSKS